MEEWQAHRLDKVHGRDQEALLLTALRMVYVLQLSMHLTKNPYFESQAVLLVALKEGRRFVESFLKSMPLMRELFKDHQVLLKTVVGFGKIIVLEIDAPKRLH